MDTELPEVHFVVKEVLPMGLCILASQPKLGKSWFALELCLAVSGGHNFLNRATQTSQVLYLALEDSANRLQSRVKTMWADRQHPFGFNVWLKALPIMGGLIPELEKHIQSHPDTKLVVLDTLQKVRGEAKRGEGIYGFDYREIGYLKEFADKHKLCLLLVHHLRKMKDDDIFNMLSGSNGILGCADTTIILTKDKRTDSQIHMNLTGRDTSYQEYVLTRDPKTMRLNVDNETLAKDVVSDIDNFLADPLANFLFELLQEFGQWKGTASELCRLCCVRSGYHVQESSNPLAMSKRLNNIAEQLDQFFNIEYIKPSSAGGKAGRVHTFRLRNAVIPEQPCLIPI